MSRGFFISVEGGEGGGKSTQITMLATAFLSAGLDCLATREPGGTPASEEIRGLLVRGDADKWNPLSETLLFQAARCEHVERFVKPALSAGTHVICDRFLDSTRVYQGVGKGQGAGFIDGLHQLTLGNFVPDITLILDIDPKAGLARAVSRKGEEMRFEQMNMAFHQQVREGFLQIATNEPARCVVVDAAMSAAEVHKVIIAALNGRLGLTLAEVK